MGKIGPFWPLFTPTSKSVKLIFGQNWPKYQAYSLTFCGKIGPFWPLFTPTSKSVKLIFGQNWPKYQAYSLTFWAKLAHFDHFSHPHQNQWNWFLVKIDQNTKPIALLFGQNWPFWPLFTPTSKSVKFIFGQNWPKYQAYSLTFWAKLAHFHHFSLPHQNQWNWFLVKIDQNTKLIALLFGQNWPIFTTFHTHHKIREIDFWSKLTKIPSL